jgi:hypothetical protein
MQFFFLNGGLDMSGTSRTFNNVESQNGKQHARHYTGNYSPGTRRYDRHDQRQGSRTREHNAPQFPGIRYKYPGRNVKQMVFTQPQGVSIE